MKPQPLLIALTVIALYFPSPALPSELDPEKNVIAGGNLEAMWEGAVPQEDFNIFWAPVSEKVENTYFNVVTDQAHSGKKSIRVALTPDTAKQWLANPGKPGFPSLWLHYSVFPKQDLSALRGKPLLFSVWVYVEKGEFNAEVKCRGWSDNDYDEMILGNISVKETGKWVELQLRGQGNPKVKKADIRLEIKCKKTSDFVVYLDDFYFGLE